MVGFNPGFAPARALRALLFEKGKDHDLALAEIQSAERASRGWADSWFRAHRAAAAGDWKAAENAYDEVLRSEREKSGLDLGSSLETRLGRGIARMEAGDYKGGVFDFITAHAMRPEALAPVLYLGRAYLLLGDIETAERHFREHFGETARRDMTALEIASMYYT